MAEAGGALAYQHYMAGMLHYGFGERTHVLDVMHCAHRAGAAGGTVHAAGIKFDHAFLVGKTAQAHAVIIGIIFRAGDDCDGGIEGAEPPNARDPANNRLRRRPRSDQSRV